MAGAIHLPNRMTLALNPLQLEVAALLVEALNLDLPPARRQPRRPARYLVRCWATWAARLRRLLKIFWLFSSSERSWKP